MTVIDLSTILNNLKYQMHSIVSLDFQQVKYSKNRESFEKCHIICPGSVITSMLTTWEGKVFSHVCLTVIGVSLSYNALEIYPMMHYDRAFHLDERKMRVVGLPLRLTTAHILKDVGR